MLTELTLPRRSSTPPNSCFLELTVCPYQRSVCPVRYVSNRGRIKTESKRYWLLEIQLPAPASGRTTASLYEGRKLNGGLPASIFELGPPVQGLAANSHARTTPSSPSLSSPSLQEHLVPFKSRRPGKKKKHSKRHFHLWPWDSLLRQGDTACQRWSPSDSVLRASVSSARAGARARPGGEGLLLKLVYLFFCLLLGE